jgi:AraC family transcriptional regulator of adaptative response/methylated-DNA-[protein]-cysteine methyltransferase
MNQQEQIDFKRITAAIDFIHEHFREQPDLDRVAEHVHLSPFHFQRMFSEWAGVSPKKFLQYTSLAYAKQLLKERQATLFDTTQETGLSGSGRLHDLFVNIEGMTPGEYKHGGSGLFINYSFSDSHFGPLLLASTGKGICYIAFTDDQDEALGKLKAEFPNASFTHQADAFQHAALTVFMADPGQLPDIKLHLKGTDFQLKVWEALLKIPMGRLSTYGQIAAGLQNPNASRAVGTAIGSNPVAFLIPCHRVIQSTGVFGGYMWGPTRKTAMIGWELAKTQDA